MSLPEPLPTDAASKSETPRLEHIIRLQRNSLVVPWLEYKQLSLGNQQLHAHVADQQTTIAELLPKTFYLFSQLPIEIRRLIWQASLAAPRVIGIRVTTNPPGSYFLHREVFGDPSRLHHVNQEARIEALRQLQQYNLPRYQRESVLYANVQKDVFWWMEGTEILILPTMLDLDSMYWPRRPPHYDAGHIARLAISIKAWCEGEDDDDDDDADRVFCLKIDYMLKRKFEEVLIVVENPTIEQHKEIVFQEPRSRPEDTFAIWEIPQRVRRHATTWKQFEDDIPQRVKYFQKILAIKKQAAIDGA
jgi:hypothetical protein